MNKKLLASEQEIQNKALQWIKHNRQKLVERFASDNLYTQDERPISVFMAGSPGAGKTEFAKMLIKDVFSDIAIEKVALIDPDEIRTIIGGYKGHNAHLFQQAVDRGVHHLHNHCLQKNKNFILDGTMHSYTRARENINRSLKRNRLVIIFYIYLDPYIAWDITKKREIVEGRGIRKKDFISKLFASRLTVEKIKEEFGTSIQLWTVKKNTIHTHDFELWSNTDTQTLDKQIKIPYDKDGLKNSL